MPPKAKVTREMIAEAAFAVAREAGAEHINARTVSEKLGCSTQPVMYHFKTIEALKRAAYERADRYHSEYLMTFRSAEPMLDMGLNYVRFAAEEKHLFRFLFQSGGFSGKNLAELLEGEELAPILEVLSQAAEVDLAQAAAIFKTLALFVHGCASMLANNALDYDEGAMARDLERVFVGAVYAAREEKKMLTKLYNRSEMWFFALWTAVYIVGESVAQNLSRAVGVESAATVIFNILLSALLFGWVRKNGLLEKYGLCRGHIPPRFFLYYIPLAILSTHNLWGGVRINMPLLDTACYIGSMLCVGFLEEVIFRGLLFRAMEKDGVRSAIVVSSLTFGLGHIVNLVNGSGMDLVSNLIQVFGAIAIGFLFVAIFYRGGSLVPCILTHGAYNALSVFGNEAAFFTGGFRIAVNVIQFLLVVLYGLYILKRPGKDRT